MSAKHMVLGKTLDANAQEMLTIWSLFFAPYSFWGRWTLCYVGGEGFQN